MIQRISKKFSFALLGIFIIMLVPIILIWLGYANVPLLVALIASDFSILLITITYLTGQAKVDFQAHASAGINKQ